MYDYNESYYNTTDNLSREIRDLDFIFGTHPLSADVRKKTNIDAIKQSIKALVLLNHYEKPFHPDIGCDIYKSLFEPFEEEFSEELMERYVKHVIDNYEPRAVFEKIDFNTREDYNSFELTVWFTPDGETDPVSVDIFLRILR